jgi:hypothetical protein
MVKILFDQTYAIPNEESRILEVEKMIGARLPDDYRIYLLKNNGGGLNAGKLSCKLLII